MAGKSFTATTSSGVIIPGNTVRKELIMKTLSTASESIFVQIGQDVSTDTGIELEPGESYRISGFKASQDIYGITKSGSVSGGYEVQ